MGQKKLASVPEECMVYSGTSEQWTRWGRVFVHYSEVLTCIQLLAGGTQFVHCREVVRSSECPLSEVPLYTYGGKGVLLLRGVLISEVSLWRGSTVQYRKSLCVLQLSRRECHNIRQWNAYEPH